MVPSYLHQGDGHDKRQIKNDRLGTQVSRCKARDSTGEVAPCRFLFGQSHALDLDGNLV